MEARHLDERQQTTGRSSQKGRGGEYAPAVNGPEGFSDYPFKQISLTLVVVSGWVCEFASKNKSWLKGVENRIYLAY